MGDLVLKGATSGQITLSPVGTAGTNTLTLPAKTGNIITSADTGTVTQAMLASNIAGNGPAFSAYANTTQVITANVQTKVTLGTEEFDTNNDFASSRFTPSVFGYYLITISAYITTGGSMTFGYGLIYKGGVPLNNGSFGAPYGPGSSLSVYSTIVRCASSADYIELYAQADGTTPTVQGATLASTSRMSGFLLRTL